MKKKKKTRDEGRKDDGKLKEKKKREKLSFWSASLSSEEKCSNWDDIGSLRRKRRTREEREKKEKNKDCVRSSSFLRDARGRTQEREEQRNEIPAISPPS